jgi:competence protein ComEA
MKWPLFPILLRRLIPLVLAGWLCCLPGVALAQVDINHADAKTLAESLDGVGLVKAEAIVAYRDRHGPFSTIDDLAKVRGIGAKTIAANRDAIVIVASPLRADVGRGLP